MHATKGTFPFLTFGTSRSLSKKNVASLLAVLSPSLRQRGASSGFHGVVCAMVPVQLG